MNMIRQDSYVGKKRPQNGQFFLKQFHLLLQPLILSRQNFHPIFGFAAPHFGLFAAFTDRHVIALTPSTVLVRVAVNSLFAAAGAAAVAAGRALGRRGVGVPFEGFGYPPGWACPIRPRTSIIHVVRHGGGAHVRVVVSLTVLLLLLLLLLMLHQLLLPFEALIFHGFLLDKNRVSQGGDRGQGVIGPRGLILTPCRVGGPMAVRGSVD